MPKLSLVRRSFMVLVLSGAVSLVVATQGFAVLGGEEGGSRTPPTLAAKISGSPPLWVSRAAATTPDGSVDWNLLGEEARKVFENLQAQPTVSYAAAQQAPEMAAVIDLSRPDGSNVRWYRYGPSSKEISGSRWRSVAEVARSARAIYLGTVTAVAEGFLDGEVGSLLTVQVDRVVRGSDDFSVTDEVFVYYPYARFSIGELNFWKETPGYPERPAVGDQILVSADRYPPDAAGRVVLPHQDGLFVEQPEESGGVVLKGAGRSRPGEATTLGELADDLAALAAGGAER